MPKATDPGKALPATTDTSGRKVGSEPRPHGVIDTRNAERGRGYLSGDGRMHPHTR